MSAEKFYAADGVKFRLKTTFDEGAVVDTLAGATITAVAMNVLSQDTVEGTAVAGAPIGDVETVEVYFAPGALGVGTWDVQVRVIPTGSDGMTLREPVLIRVLPSYAPA